MRPNPEWEKLEFEHELVMPGEPLPDLIGQPLAVDLETRPHPDHRGFAKAGLNVHRATILGIAVAVPGKAFYFPLRHCAPGSERFNLNPDVILPWLEQQVTFSPLVMNHHLKFDAKLCALAGVNLLEARDIWCTLVGSEVMDERASSHGLKQLADTLLGMPATEEALKNRHIKDARFKKDLEDWGVVPADIMASYACGDVERAMRLAGYQITRIRSENLLPIMNLEMRVLRALTASELHGIRVNVDALKFDRLKLLEQAIEREDHIERLIGVSINPNSSDELADIVTNRLGLAILRRKFNSKTKKVTPIFDDEALQEYCKCYPDRAELFFTIRQARRLHHVLSYVESYLHHQLDEVIHATFWQTRARTGRMASSDPNLQQVIGEEEWPDPITDEKWSAPGARKYFIPRDGRALLLFDYSQIEYRLFAHYANSDKLMLAYNENPNLDMHQWATDVVLKGRLSRHTTKNINFGIIYGMGKQKMVKTISASGAEMTEKEAEQTLNFYYKELPELKMLQDSVATALKQRGYVKTILGRRRRISGDWRKRKEEKKDRGLLPYQALNAICQGSATDILKDRLAACNEAGHNPLVTIHDEMIFEVPEAAMVDTARWLKPHLEAFTGGLRVPIYVNCKATTTSWAQAKEIEL